MARIAIVLTLLLTSLSLAGCAGEKTKGCADPCTTPDDLAPTSTGTQNPAPTIRPDDVLNGTIDFRNCEGVGSQTTLPIEDVRPLVPEDFDLLGFTPLTVNAHINVLMCERIVDRARVYSQTYYFSSYVNVVPRNESRRGVGPNWYLLDQRVSENEIADHVKALGFPIELARFTVTNTSAEPAAVVQNWKIESENTTFEINGVFGSEFDAGGAPMSDWGGEEQLRRIDFVPRYKYLNPKFQADALRSEGNSNTREAFGETSPMVTYILSEFHMTWTIDPQNLFKPEKA